MKIKILYEVKSKDGLCFQKCKWYWDNDKPTEGYRFVWRDLETGGLKPRRGQTYIPSATIMFRLIASAVRKGWLR